MTRVTACATIRRNMARPLHPDETKRAVIAYATEHGFADTYTQWPDLNRATIRSWCSRAGVATGGTEKTRAATAQIVATREERRERLADRLLELAEMSAEHAQTLIGDANLRDVVGLFTRAIHDHQLLIGAATTRSETVAAEELHALVDDLADRRAKHAA